MHFTVYPPAIKDNSAAITHDWKWLDIAHWLQKTCATDNKDDAPLWSPVDVQSTGRRAGHDQASFLACEYDNITLPQAEKIMEVISRLSAVVYTTSRHTTQAPRLRIAIQTTRPVTATEWSSCIDLIGLGTGTQPAAESRMSQGWYSALASARVWHFQGQPLDPAEAIQHCPPRPGRVQAEPMSGDLLETVTMEDRARACHTELHRRNPPNLFLMACMAVRDCALPVQQAGPVILNYIRQCRPEWQWDTKDPKKEVAGRCTNAQQYGQGVLGEALRPWREFDDSGNALRLLDAHRRDLRHAHQLGKRGAWWYWRATQGKWEAIPHPTWLFVKLMDDLSNQAASIAGDNGDRAAAIRKWARRNKNKTGLEAACSLAGRHPSCAIEPSALDADPYLVGLGKAGTLDLRGVPSVRPPDPGDMITHVAIQQAPEPSHKAPRFLRFVSEIFRGDEEVVAYMQRFLGSCLLGTLDDHIMQFWFGSGSNGKSTLFRLILRVLGDYSCPMPEGLMTRRKGDVHPAERATLRGRRFVVGAESKVARFDEGITKQLTAGDPMMVRGMGQDFWMMQPTAKYVLAGSHKPVIRDTDDGIWRRIHMVPFEVAFPTGSPQRDGSLFDKIVARELPGVLGWLVEGFVDWRTRGGLEPPAKIRDASDAFRRESNMLTVFLEEATEPVVGGSIKQSEIWHLYRMWAHDSGERYTLRKREFLAEIRERYRQGKSGVLVFYGLKARGNSHGAPTS